MSDYTKKTWSNGTSGVSAEAMNNIEEGVDTAHSELTTHQSSSDHDTHNDARYLGITAKAADADKLDNMNPATANTANSIVQRDASGNFAAGTITANLTGNCSGSSGSCTGNAATATSATSAGNADTLDTKHYSDLQAEFQGTVPAYGLSEDWSTSIPVGGTATWSIPLGGTYHHGVVYLRNRNNSADGSAGKAIVWFGTDSTKTMSTVFMGISDGMRMYHRGFDSVVSQSGSEDSQAPSGRYRVDILDVYISGTNLLIVFKNNHSGALYDNCAAHWKVWK